MKHIEYEIDKELQLVLEHALRTKQDLLLLLAHTIKSIVEQELFRASGHASDIKGNDKLIVHIEKMSRLFYCMNSKVFSFQMPFNIVINSNRQVEICFENLITIDSYLSSMLVTVFENKDCLDGTFIDVYERLDQLLKDRYGELSIDEDAFWRLLKELMVFEPGYIRFDDDPEHEKPQFHPRFHLDINYENASTFKVEVNKKMNAEDVMALVDLTKPCVSITI